MGSGFRGNSAQIWKDTGTSPSSSKLFADSCAGQIRSLKGHWSPLSGQAVATWIVLAKGAVWSESRVPIFHAHRDLECCCPPHTCGCRWSTTSHSWTQLAKCRCSTPSPAHLALVRVAVDHLGRTTACRLRLRVLRT